MRALEIKVQLADEAARMSELVLQACRIRHRASLQDWLGGAVQQFIPHQAVLVAWGDFRTGAIFHDVVGPGASGLLASPEGLVRLLRESFERWSDGGEQPLIVRGGDQAGTGFSALAHGLKDRLGRYDCVYIFLGPALLQAARVRDMARLLLPSIDIAFRQAVDTRPTASVESGESCEQDSFFDELADEPAADTDPSLSDREFEVMRWVRLGKTNSEIGLILNLSTFTVKNHMRRIYKKLNAGNRAQAVSRIGAHHFQ